jgi:NAD+ kinase
MRFALFPNLSKPNSVPIAIGIRDFLLQNGADVVSETEKASVLAVPPLSSVAPDDIDFLISLGGDGTILRVIHRHPELRAPIMGVNLGSLGFMADIPVQDIYLCLGDILKGRYLIQERIVMQGVSTQGETCFALNEIVIHRVKNPCLIDLGIYVGSSYLNTFSADGLIISTPNGSTAYSLSAGGPILTPNLSALVITPICPHTISNRPIVVGAEKEIIVEYLSEYDPIEVTYDGFTFHSIASSESVTICLSSLKFRLVTFNRTDFFSTMRTKLGWTGKLKNS